MDDSQSKVIMDENDENDIEDGEEPKKWQSNQSDVVAVIFVYFKNRRKKKKKKKIRFFGRRCRSRTSGDSVQRRIIVGDQKTDPGDSNSSDSKRKT